MRKFFAVLALILLAGTVTVGCSKAEETPAPVEKPKPEAE